MAEYDSNSIKSLTDIEHIRLRSSAYLPDVGIAGIQTVIRELIDNSVDECEFLGKGTIDVIMMLNHDKTNFKMIVRDTGRGIPASQLIAVFSSARTSGKFSTSAYKFSVGSFGIGSTVTCALSKYFRAITLNKDIIADATIPYTNIPTTTTDVINRTGKTGTIVIFSPDDTIFKFIPDFIQDHSILMEYFAHHSLFSTYDIRFFEMYEPLDVDINKMSSLQVIEFIDKISSGVPTYLSSTLDKNQYVKNYFGIQKPWTKSYSIQGMNAQDTLRVQGTLFFTTNGILSNQKTKLAFVNNLLFDDNGSLHTALLTKFIKTRMIHHIQDKVVRDFFLDHYKLPIFLLLDIKFSNAQFSGFAKNSFKDVAFRHPYQLLLNEMITKDMIADMYEMLSNHIQIAFNKFANKDFSVSTSMKGLLAKLNRPEKFNNCGTTDREAAELFLVEGDSAKSDQDRDSVFQASYTLGGKPFNGLTTPANISESINMIKKNVVFQDIIRILNITPGSNDLSNLNFGKTFIMADADTHGYHITNIVIGNLYLLCPRLIEEGRVFVTIPPLYSLNIKGNEPIYIRNVTELNAMLAYHVYYRCVDIRIKSDKYNHLLAREEFVAFTELVIKIGEELDRLSDEYIIPAILLEQLSLLTNHLNLNKPDPYELQKWLGCEVKYIKSSHLLIISMGSDDIVVPLNQITELIYERILPMYREFYYGKTQVFITTKNSDFYRDSPITIVQLNEIFKRLNDMFTIQRYKGLGSMPPKDRSRNCTAPKTRRVYQISSIGDIDTVFAMLGTDPSERKKLVTA